MVNGVETVSINDLDVVDFRDEKISGMFRTDLNGSRILIAKKVLINRDNTLETLVHEVAHKVGGGDGEHSHVTNIEYIWSGIVARLTDKKVEA